MKQGFCVRLLGVRGSAPVHGEAFAQFGGATSCVLCRCGGESILLDAGTGLLREGLLPLLDGERIAMLLTHSHVDHIIGFPMFSPLFDGARRCDVYLRTRNGLGARDQVEALMRPPLWPITTAALKADVRFLDVEEAFCVGDVRVLSMESSHPGGSSIFRLEYAGKSLVYATDFEPTEHNRDEFCRFAKDCDLLLLDAQYTEEEYRSCQGFGHMSVAQGAQIAARCRAGQTLLVHHDPRHTDAHLLALEREVQAACPRIGFGRAGQEILL